MKNNFNSVKAAETHKEAIQLLKKARELLVQSHQLIEATKILLRQ